MSFLDKNGLQVLTNKLVQGDAIKVASHRGHTVKNVIDNITRECENVATPNTMTLENRVSEFKVGKGRDLDVSGDVEEGKIEVGLSGRTYQNLVKENQSYTKDLVITNHTGFLFPKYDLKSNVTYTIMFSVSNLVKDGNDRVYCMFRGNNDSNVFIQFDAFYVEKNGVFAQKFTLANGLKNFLIGISASTNKNNPTFTIGDIMILEGDYTQTPIEELPKYFEGIKSSFEDGIVDVEVIGKNLFDAKDFCDKVNNPNACQYEDGALIVKNSSHDIGFNYNFPCYISFNIKTSDSQNTGASVLQVTTYDGSEIHLDAGVNGERFKKHYVPNIKSIRLNSWARGTNILKNFQIERTQFTPYEPYYKKKISFNIGEPLRSLPNGICDEIRNNNGQWELVRRTFKKIVNSNNNWNVDGASSNGRIRCHCGDLIDVIPNSSTYCDKFSYLYPPTYNYENTTRSGSGYFELILNGTTKEEFLARLNQLGDLEVIYELKNPIITPIEPIEFDVKPLATMTINSDIAPVSNHKVVLNRAGQIEQGIVQIAELKKRVDALETAYDSYLLETQHKLSILGFEYELESEEV